MNMFNVCILAAVMVSAVHGMGSKSKVEKIESDNHKVLPSAKTSSVPSVTTAPIKLIENSLEENKAVEEQITKSSLKSSEATSAKTNTAVDKKAKKTQKRTAVPKKTTLKQKKKPLSKKAKK